MDNLLIVEKHNTNLLSPRFNNILLVVVYETKRNETNSFFSILIILLFSLLGKNKNNHTSKKT